MFTANDSGIIISPEIEHNNYLEKYNFDSNLLIINNLD
jgi:hypothetical protein